ncbi:gluconate 2-dehydrogenase subunit 3 family protein [Deinococcus arenicola]|uniref:Gluconate 2-dehydrogenase subunit 3 family protein n=1 Tax=Deinococcus arenicola TaxID=2994950 RepID=A0ABU4DVV6_9DEIO|nr:gluconate 2-dehydrogenase subunit 3 family protein [Deinococcus sp. ZS9-10]MDV6376581.1 gluconate 2-dehydrogenase subunit 3 family protein [Deinococcus sp. ZS9-10]
MSETNERRNFLKGLGLVAVSVGLSSPGLVAVAQTAPPPAPPMPAMDMPAAADSASPYTYVFFNPVEIAFIEAAVARLIPKDDLGPGALEAGVAYYIDGQLASWYGEAGRWYWQGPWQQGTPQQGYQLPLKPSEVYRAGIPLVNEATQKQYKADFADLKTDQQDKVLSGLEKGEIDLGRLPAKTFFAFLLQNTKEGFFADPTYGGNAGMVGWKMIGYPGVQPSYEQIIEQYNKPFTAPPASIANFTDDSPR